MMTNKRYFIDIKNDLILNGFKKFKENTEHQNVIQTFYEKKGVIVVLTTIVEEENNIFRIQVLDK